MECLPGGRVQMALDPGEHAIEIWTPDAERRFTGSPAR
jgi:hypothetical protein